MRGDPVAEVPKHHTYEHQKNDACENLPGSLDGVHTPYKNPEIHETCGIFTDQVGYWVLSAKSLEGSDE